MLEFRTPFNLVFKTLSVSTDSTSHHPSPKGWTDSMIPESVSSKAWKQCYMLWYYKLMANWITSSGISTALGLLSNNPSCRESFRLVKYAKHDDTVETCYLQTAHVGSATNTDGCRVCGRVEILWCVSSWCVLGRLCGNNFANCMSGFSLALMMMLMMMVMIATGLIKWIDEPWWLLTWCF